MTLENLSSLFSSLITDVDEKDSTLTLDRTDEKIPSLCKFRKLAGTCNNYDEVCSQIEDNSLLKKN